MAKSSSRRSLKSLFSRSEVSLDKSVETDKNEEEKTKFSFLKLKKKTKSDPVSVKSANEIQQLHSAAEPSDTAKVGEGYDDKAYDDIIAADKRSSLYGTTTRSKGKEFSYSELDLRKPKRFATFTFGFRKKKKSDQVNISQSTFGLNRADIEAQEETPRNHRQTELDQANTKTVVSMPPTELHTVDTSEISSPPAVATNQSESHFPLPNQSQSSDAVSAQPKTTERLVNGSNPFAAPQKAPLAAIPELQLDISDSSEEKRDGDDDSTPSASATRAETSPAVDNQAVPSLLVTGSNLFAEPQKAPIAAIPELQLDSSDSSEEKRDGDDDSTPSASATRAETSPAVDNQTVPSLPAALDTSDRTAAVANSVATSDGPCDNDILWQSRTNTEISHIGSTRVTLSSHHQPETSDITNGTSQHGELSPASADSQIDGTVAQSTAVPHAGGLALDSDSASVHREVSIFRTERSAAVTARSVAKASAGGGEKGASTVKQDAVYGALYESLFPQSFGSGLMSSPSNPPPQIITEIRHLDSKSAPVMVKTLDERYTETNVQFDSAARRVDDAVGDHTNVNATFSESEAIYSSESSRLSSYRTSAASEPQRDPDIYIRYVLSSLKSGSEPGDGDSVPYSEPTRSLSEVKSDSFSLIQDNARSVPVLQSSTPPVSDYVTSQGGDTRVTQSKRRAILVKELVRDEASTDPVCPFPVPEKMSSANRLEVRIETIETFFSLSRHSGGSDGLLSPTYLSVGSDDSNAVEIYYSAEEDNEEGSGNEEMYTVDERVESCVVEGGREAGLREDFPQQVEVTERGIRQREEGEFRVVIIKMQNEGVIMANEEEREDVNSRFEEEEQVRGQRSDTPVQETETSEFLVGSDAESREKEVATVVLPQVGGEEAEELPATPVQQVYKPEVCDFAPPSSELQGEWEGAGSAGNLTEELETEDPPNGEAPLPGQEAQYLAHKDLMSSECMHTASSSTGEGDKLTPRPSEAEEQVSPVAETAQTGEASQDATDTTDTTETTDAGIDTAGSAVTATSAGGDDTVTDTTTHATEVEHNRAASSKWVDPITQSTERTATAQEQVAVSVDTRLPDLEAAGTRSERRPSEEQPDQNQGPPTASRTQLTAASEGFASVDQPPTVEKGSVTEMNLGYSSLSTTLSIKNSSPPKEDESKNRFQKVSLINEANTTEVSQDTVDFSQDSTAVAESNGTDSGSEYRWRNRFVGVSQYRSHSTDNSSFSDSLSYRMSDSYSGPSSFSSSSSSSSSSSALPDSTAYKHLSSSSSSSSYSEGHITNRLSDMNKVPLSYESEPVGAPKDEWRRSLLEREEPAAPAEAERFESRWDSHQLPLSGISSAHGYNAIDRFDDDDSSRFTGVFKATLVELVSEPAAPPSTPPASPDEDSPIQFDMDSLVDTLKSMGPSMRPRNTSLRGAPPVLVSFLPPIVEDAPGSVAPDIPAYLTSPAKKMEAMGNSAESLKGHYTLPSDVGLKRNVPRDTRSPLELMKQNQQQEQEPGTRGLNLTLRSSVTNSLVLRRSDSSPEDLKSPVLNGNGLLPPSITGSRLDNSVIFGNHRSASTDQTFENGKTHRPLFRSGSLPDKGPSNDRMSSGKMELGEPGSGTEPAGSRFDRFSFLLNSTASPSGSLTGAEGLSARMSMPPPRGIGSPPSSSSPAHLLIPTASMDLQRPFTTTDSSPFNMFGQTQGMGMGAGTGPVGNPILQRSFSSEGIPGVQQTSLFNSRHGGSQFQSQEIELEKNLAPKYRAFPDAYLTKEKEHGKLNPRPGKMYIFDRPGMCGQRIEVRSDVIDATPWELQETISIRVVRGGWVLYEKPNFKGEKIALDEGDIELTYPFDPEEQLQNGEKEAGKQNVEKEAGKLNGEHNGETSDVPTEPARKFIIGSLRRAVRDYSVPEICLFPEEDAEGKKVTFRDTSEDARIFGFPIKANSIIINAGLWLVYAHPFFQGLPRVLEVGGFSNPAAWGVEQPYVGSLHPLKVGEPRVENTSEPKMVIFEKPYFTGKSRTISTNMRDFMTRADRQQTAFMYNIGSLKVQGGMWVGYEKEGFRGHQYLLEEGEYHDWRVWGGRDVELRSVRVIRADLTDPMMVMFEQPEEEQEGMDENTFEVTEAIPDVELFEYRTSTRSIHVLSGAWIAYSHVDYSGNQYILEKGFYNNCADWGSQDSRICSVQPIRLAPSDSSTARAEVILYSEPDFQGECHVFKHNQEELPEKLLTKSCRVSGTSWVLYENTHHSGNLYVLSEGDFPNLTSMGCPPVCTIRSVKVVPMTLSVPSISLFGLECLEGREITMETEIPNMVEEGFNNHILSVRVNSSCWVICEHSNYRGRQFLLEPIEITNWPKFSSIQTIGSMFPVRQKRRFLRIKNKESGHFLSVQGGAEEMKSGRVVVTPEAESMSDIWFYQDGFIKSKLSPTMSLQVMGNIEPGAKVVLWTETRQPVQTWTAQMRGLITSLTFPGCVMDVKGGKTYDKDHVVIMPESEERPSQQWEIELL